MGLSKLFVFFLVLAVSGVLSVPTPAEVTPGTGKDARSPDKDLETSETFILGGGYGLGLGYGLYGGWGGWGGYGGYPWGGYYGGLGYPYGIYG